MKREELKEEVREYVEMTTPDGRASVEQLRRALPVTRTEVEEAAEELVDEGILVDLGDGLYGSAGDGD